MGCDNKDPYGLKPVWDAIIKVYLEFAKICDRHGLRYYVVDGNAIGAVRHGGFIPWDDDFDVAMPRRDYDRFLEIAETELPNDLKIVTWCNTPEFNMLSAKVQLANRDVVGQIENVTGRMLSNGIFIDIFPIDGATTSDVKWVVESLWYFMLECLLRFHNDKLWRQTKKGKVVWFVGMALSPLLFWMSSHDIICGKLDKLQRRNDFNNSSLYDSSAFMSGVKRRKRHQVYVWGNPVMVDFESIKVPLPEHYKEYLRFWYGDYMRMPSIEAQKPPHQYGWRCEWWLGPTNP